MAVASFVSTQTHVKTVSWKKKNNHNKYSRLTKNHISIKKKPSKKPIIRSLLAFYSIIESLFYSAKLELRDQI